MEKQPLFPRWAVLSAFLSWLLPLLFLLKSPSPGIDISLLTYMGREMLSGVDVMRDYFEVNPPGILYLYMPSVLVAGWLHVAEPYVLLVQTWLAMGVSLLAGSRILTRAASAELLDRDGLRLGMAGLWLFMPWLALFYQVAAQREHWLMILALPWLLVQLLNARHVFSNRERLAIALFAGIGFAIKPYFVLMPLSIGAWYIWHAVKRERVSFWNAVRLRWLTWDYLPLVGITLLYYAYLLLVERTYLREVVPVAMETYSHFGNRPLAVLQKLLVTLAVPLLMYAVAKPRSESRRLLMQRQFWLMVGCAMIVWLQMKGFSYHFLPLWWLTGMLIWLPRATDRVFVQEDWLLRLAYVAHRTVWLLPVAFLLGLMLKTASEATVKKDMLVTIQLENIFAEKGIGEGNVVQVWLAPAFPTINKLHLRTSMPFPYPWFLTSFYEYESPAGFSRYTKEDAPNPFHPPEEMKPAERYLFDLMVRRFVAEPPDMVVLYDAPWEKGYGFDAFDFWRYYRQSPDFAKRWAEYEEIEGPKPYRLWKHHISSH
ncbi:hypothetical protein GC177_08005 [bacterium]|nr:hypothetical protein [bacterium]